MSFEQTRFLGSSVTSFSASLGWGDTSSQVSVGLVDDVSGGDSFTPGNTGRPVTFAFNGFLFTGILSSYSQNIGTSGNTYEVTVDDPRELLDGTQIILDGYTGDVSSIYNVLNVYGYLESFGFGSSQKNETGIPWKNIRDTLHTITNLSQQSTYGGPLYFLQSRYVLDLYGLPDVPEDFRVGGENISVLQFITEVCEAGGCEFYVSMVEATTGVFVIKVNTVNRSAVINYGAVTTFLGLYPEYETKKVGFEFSNETTSKFLVGGNIRELWYQYSDASINTIWPFWGFDLNGNPIIGEGYNDDHTFVLDSRAVANPRVGAFYQTNVAELRAILAGRASWESFLIFNRGNGGIHSNKAVYLNIVGYINNADPASIIQKFVDNYNLPENNHTLKLDPGKDLFPHNTTVSYYEQLDIETQYLYDFLYHIATTYYGKQFMVAIPYTYSAEEQDTGLIRLSQLPVDSAYLDENLWPYGISNNLLPLEVDRFTEEDGKIEGFVRFDNGDYLDISGINPDSVAFNSREATFGRNKLRNISVFVKCSIDEAVVFLDKDTRYGPRVIITLDDAVKQRVQESEIPGKELLVRFIKDGFQNNPATAGVDVNSAEFNQNVIQKFISYVGQDILNYGNESSAVLPSLAVVPLESQTNCYGPWYGTGAAGRVDYEKDDTLVPWHYGGYTAMNLAAEAKVTQAVGTNLQLEQGEITFPDAPFHSLGEPLVAGGPTVTSISVSIGDGGAHTTYSFRRNVKQPRYGQAKADRVAQISRRQHQLRRNARLRNYPKRRADIKRTAIPINQVTKVNHPKVGKHSSHETICGQLFHPETDKTEAAVFIQSDYNFHTHIQHDYAEKAFMSLDGLFVPYSTVAKDGYPSFETPSEDAAFPTVNHLNPFSSGSNIKLLAVGNTLPSNLYDRPEDSDDYAGNDNYRALAFRAPMILSGWGVDTDGKPVPNLTPDDPGDSFLTERKLDASTWKTGPLDARWDNNRKVWVAGGGNSLIRGTMMSATRAEIISTGETHPVINWLGSTIGSGDNVYLTLDNGEYYIVNQEYYSVGPNGLISSIECNEDGTFDTCNKSFKIPCRVTSSPTGCI